MSSHNDAPVRKMLRRVMAPRAIARMGGLLDELEVGLVALDASRDYADVNEAASTLLGIPAGPTTVTTCTTVIRELAGRALNTEDTTEVAAALAADSDVEFKGTWVFSAAPTHLGVVSKPAPWLDGRIWTFYDNSRMAQAIDSADRANAMLRASSDAMFDPQVLLEGVWRDDVVVDLIYRDVNKATCEYLDLTRAELLGHSLLDSLPTIGGVLLAHYTSEQRREPLILDAFPYHNEDDGTYSYFDVRANQVRPGWIALTWRDVTDRFELTQRIARSEQRLKSELDSAADYVASILPDDLDGQVRVSSRFVPSRHLGGDSYDYQWIDDDHLVVYLVDVSGHGVGPAMMSVSVHNLLRSGTFDNDMLLRPSAVLTELNRLFQMDRQAGNYFTIWYGVYQASTRSLRFASGGHPPALVFAGGALVAELNTDALPVGILDATEFGTGTYQVPPDADIVLYSDGAFELTLPDGGYWTLAGFTGVCERAAATPDWTLDTLIADLLRETESGYFEDDCTLVRLSIPR
ncbi:MAG TPA: PP2C family protein-serine/threonine phosphatase [Mycobacterium sp.]|nr:PP2C family protein-serine/threonine phosphatase [Mycobacterium sp.]